MVLVEVVVVVVVVEDVVVIVVVVEVVTVVVVLVVVEVVVLVVVGIIVVVVLLIFDSLGTRTTNLIIKHRITEKSVKQEKNMTMVLFQFSGRPLPSILILSASRS